MCLIFKEKLVSNLYYKKIQGNKRFFKFYKSSKFYVIGKFVSYVKRQVSEKRFLILRKFWVFGKASSSIRSVTQQAI